MHFSNVAELYRQCLFDQFALNKRSQDLIYCVYKVK
jgi:hypothetical protein